MYASPNMLNTQIANVITKVIHYQKNKLLLHSLSPHILYRSVAEHFSDKTVFYKFICNIIIFIVGIVDVVGDISVIQLT